MWSGESVAPQAEKDPQRCHQLKPCWVNWLCCQENQSVTLHPCLKMYLLCWQIHVWWRMLHNSYLWPMQIGRMHCKSWVRPICGLVGLCFFAVSLGCDTNTQGPQKIRVSSFMSLFLSTNKQPLKCGLIWLLLVLLTANVLLFVHLWHPSP